MLKNHSVFTVLLQHELKMQYRQRGEWLTPLAFYLFVVCLFPFALGSMQSILRQSAAGIIWIALLLSLLMSLPRLFHSDLNDGSLAQYCLRPSRLMPYISAKLLAYAILYILPCLLLTPLLALLFYLPFSSILVLVLTLALGSPILLLIGSLGAALTLKARESGALLALVIFPLYIPILILALNCVNLAEQNLPISALLAWLSAYCCVAIALIPSALKAILKIGVA